MVQVIPNTSPYNFGAKRFGITYHPLYLQEPHLEPADVKWQWRLNRHGGGVGRPIPQYHRGMMLQASWPQSRRRANKKRGKQGDQGDQGWVGSAPRFLIKVSHVSSWQLGGNLVAQAPQKFRARRVSQQPLPIPSRTAIAIYRSSRTMKTVSMAFNDPKVIIL